MLGPHPGPRRRVASAVALLLATAALSACDDEVDPVDIPFEGVDPSAAVAPPTAVPLPKPTASASATAAGRPGGAIDPNRAAAAAVRACCGSLSAAARSAKDEGGKAMNRQAAQVCSRKVALVSSGKLTRAAALAQVRSSLLGPAPGACR